MKKLLRKIKNVIDRLPVDNKLIVSGVTGVVTYALTYAATRAGLDLERVVIAPWTVSAIIATVAAGAAGYFTANEATTLREGDSFDGNPDPALIAQHGLDDAAP